MFDENFLNELVDKYTIAVYRPNLPFIKQKQAIISFRQHCQKVSSDNEAGYEIVSWLATHEDVITRHAIAQLLIDNFDDNVIYKLYRECVRDYDAKLSYSILKNIYQRIEIDPLNIFSNTKAMNRLALISATFSSETTHIVHVFEYLMQHKLTNEINWALLNLLGWSNGSLIREVFYTFEISGEYNSIYPNPKIVAAFILAIISSNPEYLNWLIDTAWHDSVDGDQALEYLCYLAHPACIPILKKKIESAIIYLDKQQIQLRLSAMNIILSLEICKLLVPQLELFQDSDDLDTLLNALRNVLGISTFEYEILYNYEGSPIKISEYLPTYANNVIDSLRGQNPSLRYYKGKLLEYDNLLDLLKSPHHGHKQHGYYQLMAITGKRNLFDLFGDNFNNLYYINQWEDNIKLGISSELNGKWKFKGIELESYG